MAGVVQPPFWQQAARILNSGQARALLLTGNIHDLFPLDRPGSGMDYATLVESLLARWSVADRILVGRRREADRCARRC